MCSARCRRAPTPDPVIPLLALPSLPCKPRGRGRKGRGRAMRLAWLGKRRGHPRPPIQPMRLAARAIVVPFLEMFKEFQPGQKAASFTIDQAFAKMSEAANGAVH